MPHKLLLADDSVTIQRVIELTFADEEITVIAVGDGRQAIERVQVDRPDIVLADVGMPERDGYEVAAFIKGTPDLAHIPVLLLTGAFEPIDEGRAQAAGCDGVLVKPFEPQMVISRVKDLLAGRRPVQKMPAPQAQSPDTMRAAAAAQTAPPGHVDAQPPSGTIEDYFDRLDAAFASLDGAPAAQTSSAHEETFDISPDPPRSADGGLGLIDELANWNPAVGTPPPSEPEPAPRERVETPPAHIRMPPQGDSPRPAPPPASGSLPTLAEAFTALLAAEQGQEFAPAAATRDAVDDDVVEQVTRRVIERLGDAAVRDIVVDVAERLVREEIARIKSNAR